MRMQIAQELRHAPIVGEEDFESPDQEMGMPGTLPGGMIKDVNNELCPISKGNMVKENNS